MLKALRPTVYAQLAPERLSVHDVRSGRRFEAVPIGAVLDGPITKVIRVGDEARTASADRPLRIVNPFAHPRSLIGDFTLGTQVLKGFLRRLYPLRFVPRRPVLVLHPRVDPEGGFTDVEIRALREMGLGAGASSVYLWQGRELLERELRALEFPSGGKVLE